MFRSSTQTQHRSKSIHPLSLKVYYAQQIIMEMYLVSQAVGSLWNDDDDEEQEKLVPHTYVLRYRPSKHV